MIFRKLTAAILAVLLLITLISGVSAAETEPVQDPDALHCIQQLLLYYQHYGKDAAVDLEYWMKELKQIDPQLGEIWEKILTRWAQLDAGEAVQACPVPDMLPGDDSLCFIVFGYTLNSDSSISSELLGRSQVALEATKKYPNALILCTGGGTGSANRVYSEAWRIYEYLANQGVNQERIVIENKARTTTENVQKSFAILTQEHPEVRGLVLITSDYMVPRAELLLYTQSLYAVAATGDDPIEIWGYGASDPYNPGNETAFQKAAGLAIIAGLNYDDYEKLEAPALSQLTGILVSCAAELEFGQSPELTVTAQYDSGITRDVTDTARCTGLDPHKEGLQTLTVEYTEGDKTVSATLDVTVLPLPTEAPPETESSPEHESAPTETSGPVSAEQPSAFPSSLVIIAAVGLGLLFLLGWFLKKHKGCVAK